jgi:tocopherol cyclase
MSLFKLNHPEIFQGNLRMTNYFEGWYFKQVSADFSEVLSIIPGVSLAKNPHAFIQVIDGITGLTDYVQYPITEFHADTRQLILRIGKNRFSTAVRSMMIA